MEEKEGSNRPTGRGRGVVGVSGSADSGVGGSPSNARRPTGSPDTASNGRLSGRKTSTSPSGGSGSRSPGSGGTGSREMSPNLIEELAKIKIKGLALRPEAGGTIGRPIDLRANFFAVRCTKKDVMVHQYHLDIQHPGNRKLDKDENRLIFWAVVNAHGEYFRNKYGLAFDGEHEVYTMERCRFPDDKPSIKLEAKVPLPKDPREETEVSVTFQMVGPVLLDLTKARLANVESRIVTPVQILDVIFRQGLTYPHGEAASRFYSFKASFYRIPQAGHDGSALDLGGGKQLWSGFFTSLHVGRNNQPILNVDVSNTAFYKMRLPMIEYMCDVLNDKHGQGAPMGGGMRGGRGGGGRGGYNQGPPQPAGPYNVAQLTQATRLGPADMKTVADTVKGLKVRIAHRQGMVRVYRVNALVDAADRLTFQTEEQGVKVTKTVADYFLERYGPLRFPALPCLHVGPVQRNIYFPIEVCELEGPQKYAKKLNEKQTSAVIRATAAPADVRARKIDELIKASGFAQDPFLREFGVTVDTNMMQVKGRVLPPPAILYNKTNNSQPRVMPNDGAWDSMTQKLLEPAVCNAYSLIALLPPKEEQTLQNFCNNINRKANEMGVRFPQWPDIVKYGRTKEDVESAFKEIVAAYKAESKQCDLVFVVMQAKNTDIYMLTKDLGDMLYGIMTQCLLFKNIMKSSPATCSNIVLKINAKLGGINNQIEADEVARKYLVQCNTLVFGIDVTHPTLMEEKQGMPSVASVVANIDQLPQKYGANVKVQKKCNESVVYLLDAVRERLVAFYKHTKAKPDRIIVYRDGVSEGQFMEVLREEMQGIRTACLMLSHEYKPPITYVVTTKRHHARFFPSNPRDASGRSKNVPAGTCVDTEVNSPEAFDFYLNSHQGIQGTCRPTRYTVLWDETGFTSNELQLLTYQLCHMYCRCPRAVSIPAPVYYADLIATRARYHIKRKLGVHDSDSMSDAGSSRSGRGLQSSAASTTTRDDDASTDVSSRGRGSRGRGVKKAGRVAPSQAAGSSDSGLQECVTVADEFKSRMYFV